MEHGRAGLIGWTVQLVVEGGLNQGVVPAQILLRYGEGLRVLRLTPVKNGWTAICFLVQVGFKTKINKSKWTWTEFLRIFPDFEDFLQISHCLQGKKNSLYCVQTSSFLFVGMWRVCKSSKIEHPGGSGEFWPLDQRETQVRYPFFRIFYFCQITPLLNFCWISYSCIHAYWELVLMIKYVMLYF